jgi:hypothetical protein
MFRRIMHRKVDMKLSKAAKSLAVISVLGLAGLSSVGCARPGEFGYTPAYTTKERGEQIARNWDYEGKQSQDDIDSMLLLRPASKLTIWSVR